ncbi:MAG: sugar ABC transporter permease [Anaerolineae bacterium]
MSSVTTSAPSERPSLVRRLGANLQTYGLIGAVILIWLLFAVLTNGIFLGARNISFLFRQMSVTGIMSVGMVLVIVTGNIDLSVGRLAGFVSVIVSMCQMELWPWLIPQLFPGQDPVNFAVVTTILSVVVGIVVGTLFGIYQGYIIAQLRVPAFIVTLGGLWALQGVILIVTGGQTISARQDAFLSIANGYLPTWAGAILAAAVTVFLFANMVRSRRRKLKYGFELPSIYLDILKTGLFSALFILYVYVVNQYNGVQSPVLILAIVAMVVNYVSTNTRFGRYAYAIGGNREAARLSGVNIRNNLFAIFVLMGFLCGVGGVVLASYVGGGTPAAGTGMELDVIAACILGGTSTLGGEGTILGAMIGALIMATLTNGLQLMNIPNEWQYVIKSAVLILAVYADVRLRRNR